MRDQKDTIYQYLKGTLSDGFATYDAAVKFQTYEQMSAIVTGSDGSISYGPHTGRVTAYMVKREQLLETLAMHDTS